MNLSDSDGQSDLAHLSDLPVIDGVKPSGRVGEAYSRYRIQFGKTGPLRYCSLLDLTRVWERTLRRADIPLAYSQGFNPRPKLQIAAGLPLGYASTCEILDIWLEGEPPESGNMLERLQRAAPQGLDIETVQPVDLRGPALQSLAGQASYLAVLEDSNIEPEVIGERLEVILSQEHIWRERRGKSYDLRPLIQEAGMLSDKPLVLRMVLALSQSRGTGRPDEVLEALGLNALSACITRTAILFETP